MSGAAKPMAEGKCVCRFIVEHLNLLNLNFEQKLLGRQKRGKNLSYIFVGTSTYIHTKNRMYSTTYLPSVATKDP